MENSELLKMGVKLYWRNNEGPIENLFRLATYAAPFTPIGNWWVLAFDKLVSYAWGMGFEDFGAWLDEGLGLGPRADLGMSQLDKAEDLASQKLSGQMRTASIQKNAAWFSITKNIISYLFRGIKFFMKWAITALGLTSLGEIYNLNEKLQKEPLEGLKNMMEEGEEIKEIQDELKQKYNL